MHEYMSCILSGGSGSFHDFSPNTQKIDHVEFSNHVLHLTFEDGLV